MQPQSLLSEPSAEEAAQQCMTSMAGALACLSISIGHKLGLFQQLQTMGPCSPAGLAAAAGLSERWVREWCHQLAAGRFITCDAHAATFWLSEGQRAVLVEAGPEEQPRTTPLEMVCMMPTVLAKVEQHAACFKSGGGLTFDGFGTQHMLHSHRHAKAVRFSEQLCMLPGLQQKLKEGVRVADIGCGSGEILLHLATTYPASTFVGYDTSPQSLGLAELRASEQGLQNLTLLNPSDGPECQLPCQPNYHAVLMHDSLHDMSHPQELLAAIRNALLVDSSSSSSSSWTAQQQQADALADYNGGPLLFTSDPAASDDSAVNIQMPAAPLLYGYSVGLCLGSGLSEQGGAGLGTLGLNEAVARRMSAAAGFSRYALLKSPAKGDVNCYHMFRP